MYEMRYQHTVLLLVLRVAKRTHMSVLIVTRKHSCAKPDQTIGTCFALVCHGSGLSLTVTSKQPDELCWHDTHGAWERMRW